MAKLNKTKSITTLLACSLIALGGVASIALTTTSCSKEAKNSWYSLVSDPSVHHYFSKSNTPIENFCLDPTKGGYGEDGVITIRGEQVNANDLYSVTFGYDYNNVTSVGDLWFGCTQVAKETDEPVQQNKISKFGASSEDDEYAVKFTNLVSLDFGGFTGLTSVGCGWMSFDKDVNGTDSFPSLSSIDFSGLRSLQSVGNISDETSYWMYGTEQGDCFKSLKTIIVDSVSIKGGVEQTGIEVNGETCFRGWTTGQSDDEKGTIYGYDYAVENSWQFEGSALANWKTSNVAPDKD